MLRPTASKIHFCLMLLLIINNIYSFLVFFDVCMYFFKVFIYLHVHTHTHTRLTALCPGLPG